jgi:hypothetical protein
VRGARAPIEEPHIGLFIDTSGSMGSYEYALGPIAWILTDGSCRIGGLRDRPVGTPPTADRPESLNRK